jgi:hypothetical protein
MKPSHFPLPVVLLIATWLPCPGNAAERLSMPLLTFDGPELPRNKAGATYPSQYEPDGTAKISLDPTDAVSGKSIRFDVTKGCFYAQFNAHNADGTRGFAREYVAQPDKWRFNTFNRMSFWIKCPVNAVPLRTDGRANTDVGTYVKRIKDADGHSDEAGGNHWYHGMNLANTGTWTKVVLNMHPHHYRGASGQTEHHNQPHPTGGQEYNYFDTLTRFYIAAESYTPPTYPLVYHLDQFEFYQESHTENDEQVYTIAATVVPADNRLILTWSRDKDQNNTKHEVRYAFSSIHEIGWDRAMPAPDGIVSPPGWQGYNHMLYVTTKLPLVGKRTVFLAIKPEGAKLFSQIELPLTVR